MRKALSFVFAMTLSLWALSTAKGASLCDSVSGNIVSNCGFESGSFSGWSVTGNLLGGVNGNYVGVDSSNPNSGNYEAYFGAPSSNFETGSGNLYGPSTVLSQTVAALPGEYYQVQFFVDQAACTPGTGDNDCGPGYHNSFSAFFDGAKLLSEKDAASTNGSYQEYSFIVGTTAGVVPYNSNLLEFDYTNDAGYWYIDDVSVQAVGPTPEPATFLLVAPFLGSLYWARRRKKSA
ncbi:MAG: hypothetical protein JO340_09460 [Acidobacteriaceae bacterium]|nr:hypothetical protein [Acidobacteriaceae bacterium]